MGKDRSCLAVGAGVVLLLAYEVQTRRMHDSSPI